MKESTTMRMQARMESLRSLLDAALECARRRNFHAERLNELEMILEEILVNIISYAYPATVGEIEMLCRPDGKDGLCIVVTDTGIPFNMLERGDPDLEASIEDRPIGGLGIYLVKKLANDVHYRREEGKNILTLIVRRKTPEA